MSTTYSAELGLAIMTPGDPAVKNSWGAVLDSGVIALIDTSIAGVLPLNVAGSSNVTLTYNQGAADQSRNPVFVLSGLLTGNIIILWPESVTRKFWVVNNTTGAFTVELAVNNGSGSAAGDTIIIPQTVSDSFISDGTNILPAAQIATHAGKPNGVITGGYLGQMLWDTTNSILWVYSGSGTVWRTVVQNLSYSLPGVSVPNNGVITTIGYNPVSAQFTVSGDDGSGNAWSDLVTFYQFQVPAALQTGGNAAVRNYFSAGGTGVLQMSLTGTVGAVTVAVNVIAPEVLPF